MYLSDVFKYTQGLGQKGHQIGRKVGDAIELLTLGMINNEQSLTDFLIVEDGVEGATTAKHKVEFSFYNFNQNNQPSKNSADLFGLIECKKVGVEQTVKSNFKDWKAKAENKTDFNLTNGYSFTISPTGTNFKWSILVDSKATAPNNIRIKTLKSNTDNDDVTEQIFEYNCLAKSQLLISLDIDNNLHVLGSGNALSEIPRSLKKCVIVQIETLSGNNVKSINVNESLPGPQTPEKAKQASFVSLDVRKKVLGQFDKSLNKSFVSILVIGEISHWEEKSRSMVRLCNDYNLYIPDEVLVYLFSQFEITFGVNSQNMITKTNYRTSQDVRTLVNAIIQNFNGKILKDMDSENFVKFKHEVFEGSNRLFIDESVCRIVQIANCSWG